MLSLDTKEHIVSDVFLYEGQEQAKLNNGGTGENMRIFRGRDTEEKGDKRAFWSTPKILHQRCPTELSATTEIFCISTVQYGNH